MESIVEKTALYNNPALDKARDWRENRINKGLRTFNENLRKTGF